MRNVLSILLLVFAVNQAKASTKLMAQLNDLKTKDPTFTKKIDLFLNQINEEGLEFGIVSPPAKKIPSYGRLIHLKDLIKKYPIQSAEHTFLELLLNETFFVNKNTVQILNGPAEKKAHAYYLKQQAVNELEVDKTIQKLKSLRAKNTNHLYTLETRFSSFINLPQRYAFESPTIEDITALTNKIKSLKAVPLDLNQKITLEIVKLLQQAKKWRPELLNIQKNPSKERQALVDDLFWSVALSTTQCRRKVFFELEKDNDTAYYQHLSDVLSRSENPKNITDHIVGILTSCF